MAVHTSEVQESHMANLTVNGAGTCNPPQGGELDGQDHHTASQEAPLEEDWGICCSHMSHLCESLQRRRKLGEVR